jgi:uncharacterized protein (TIGR03790 family)
MRFCAWVFMGVGLLVVNVQGAETEAARVVVLANADDAESVELAHYYAGKRGVPEANIVALKLSLAEAVTWKEFVETLFNPLQDELAKRGWIDGMRMEPVDTTGRRKYVMSGHNIAYLVVCRGVPLRVEGTPDMATDTPVLGNNAAFRTHTGAVDGELALLASSGTPTLGVVINPLFKKVKPTALELGSIVRVSRLDGPSLDDARGLVDHAIEAEKTGLIGRAYFDIGGPHASGDRWLAETLKKVEALGYDTEVERSGATFTEAARFDVPVLYFGWYAGALNGPFARAGFKFPVGAIAFHIHSYSAATLRSPGQGWVGPLVARGVTATFGNVSEPYLEFTHQPPLILEALARGETLGAAAAYAVPVYSWQAMAVGDPLYRPFKVSWETQLARREMMPAAQQTYVVLRRMNLLEQEGKRNEAIWAGLDAQKKNPGLALAWGVAKLQRAAGDDGGERAALANVASRRVYMPEEEPLAAQAARRLLEMGDAKAATTIWSRVLGGRNLTTDTRIEWLKNAIEAARAAGDKRWLGRWEEELVILVPAPAAEVAR